jgi:transcriptional regulator with XRE-family HTH domain
MTEPATFGAGLLARAREHGMTSEDLADLLGFSVAHVRALPGPAALNNHPAMVLRTLAERLDLPWPGWLTTENSWPDPPTSDERTDPAQVHAVLAAAFTQTLHLGEIADVLDWDTDRVRRAIDLLATRARPGGGTRLTITGDTLTLTLAPGMLDHAARRRLNQLLHAHGLGPDPHVLHLIHQLSNPYAPRTAADSAPDLITEALEYRLVDYETDPETGATELGLHPDVKFSLGITQFRYPLEGEPDESTTEDP